VQILDVLYRILDVLVYPLFWLPVPVSLTAVSAGAGLLLMGVYAKTSDQWALAHHKKRLKRLQFRLLSGEFSPDVLKGLARHNARMALYGLVPAVACVLLLVLLIPWVGTRFGYYALPPMRPFAVTVETNAPWSLRADRTLRITPDRGRYDAGTTTIRMLSETPTEQTLTLEPAGGEPVDLSLRTGARRSPLWPVHARGGLLSTVRATPPNLARPRLPGRGSVRRVSVDYPMALGGLTFTVPPFLGMPAWGLSGWLSWLFLVATASGLWAKSRWEIE